MTTKYIVTTKTEHAEVGEIVYSCSFSDYGCASDDTRHTGIEHRSYTRSPDGGYPFFTLPIDSVRAIMTYDATKMKQELYLALAECERLRALLICTRSSVALDLRMYGQFLDRKGAGANDCDTDEYARIERLLNDIDAIDAARAKP